MYRSEPVHKGRQNKPSIGRLESSLGKSLKGYNRCYFPTLIKNVSARIIDDVRRTTKAHKMAFRPDMAAFIVPIFGQYERAAQYTFGKKGQHHGIMGKWDLWKALMTR